MDCTNCVAMDEALDVAAREILMLREKIRFFETRSERGPAMCQADGFAEDSFNACRCD